MVLLRETPSAATIEGLARMALRMRKDAQSRHTTQCLLERAELIRVAVSQRMEAT